MKDIHLVVTQDYSKLIGTCYAELDCWGIVREFYKIHGIELNEYYKDAPNNQEVSASLISIYRKDFKKVGEPKYGDIILIDLMGYVSHCGVYVGDGKFLHTNRTLNCVVDTLSRWERRIVGYYRVKNND